MGAQPRLGAPTYIEKRGHALFTDPLAVAHAGYPTRYDHPPQSDALPVLSLDRLTLDECDWSELDARSDRLIFQTREWLSFVAATQGAKPVVCAVLDGGRTCGYFTGLEVRRFGARILASPLPGWSTHYMGFNLDEGISREEAVRALMLFAHDELGCHHVELRDRFLEVRGVERRGYSVESIDTFEIDLRPSEDELLARMSKTCRWSIRKARREGVFIEESYDPGFARDYYSQLEDVFAKQRLRPTYDIKRVQALQENLLPTGRLLLLRARNAEGDCIATGIFPAMNETAYFWGGASWRSGQILRPNELLFWHAMRYWRDRGITTLDTCGGGEYKRKYGVSELSVPHLVHSSVPGVRTARQAAQTIHTSKTLRRIRRAVSRP